MMMYVPNIGDVVFIKNDAMFGALGRIVGIERGRVKVKLLHLDEDYPMNPDDFLEWDADMEEDDEGDDVSESMMHEGDNGSEDFLADYDLPSIGKSRIHSQVDQNYVDAMARVGNYLSAPSRYDPRRQPSAIQELVDLDYDARSFWRLPEHLEPIHTPQEACDLLHHLQSKQPNSISVRCLNGLFWLKMFGETGDPGNLPKVRAEIDYITRKCPDLHSPEEDVNASIMLCAQFSVRAYMHTLLLHPPLYKYVCLALRGIAIATKYEGGNISYGINPQVAACGYTALARLLKLHYDYYNQLSMTTLPQVPNVHAFQVSPNYIGCVFGAGSALREAERRSPNDTAILVGSCMLNQLLSAFCLLGDQGQGGAAEYMALCEEYMLRLRQRYPMNPVLAFMHICVDMQKGLDTELVRQQQYAIFEDVVRKYEDSTKESLDIGPLAAQMLAIAGNLREQKMYIQYDVAFGSLL